MELSLCVFLFYLTDPQQDFWGSLVSNEIAIMKPPMGDDSDKMRLVL